MRRWFVLVCLALMLSVIASALLLGILMLIWRLRGGRILSVQTASMVPVLRPGDAVLIARTPFWKLLPGDVVSYRNVTGIIVTHRIITINQAESLVIVQGDALGEADPPVPYRSVIGKVRWYVPRVGKLADVFKHSWLLLSLVYGAGALVVIHETKRFARWPYGRYRLAGWRL